MSGPRLRHLPLPDQSAAWTGPGRWAQDADVVVVGSGAAGMSAALAAAGHGLRVLLITKEALGGGATPLAQGGLAAALAPGDTEAQHQRDTAAAGASLCDPRAVATLAAEAPGEIGRLAVRGARLDDGPLHREGGHSRNRIVHAGGDAAGAEVHRVLRASLLDSPVDTLTQCAAVDVLTGPDGRVGGLLAGLVSRYGGLRLGVVSAPAVVLATGGFGQAFGTTTNPAGLTGDGLALAARAGAELRDIEFVQFHPTVLWQPQARGECPLITEALRGAGAVLIDAAGQPVMAGQHPLGDLAPRDVVSAVMQQRMIEPDQPTDHLYLDATMLGRAALERDFPTVTAACRARGIDPVTEPIPVAPGAHYTCGGILADLDGRTSIAGLYAVGEAASTGVHGANRLASNSLTESLITGRRAGDLLGTALPSQPLPSQPRASQPRASQPRARRSPAGLAGSGPAADLRGPAAGPGMSAAARPSLAAAMSRQAGVLRDRAGLESLLRRLDQAPPAERGLDLAVLEATSLHTVCTLVVTAALARPESRGCHRWRDVPAVSAGPARHTVLRAHGTRLDLAGTSMRRSA
jgi:L-aspartate oxidase